MDDQARRFQEAALQHNRGRSGRGIRYPKELHEEAVAYTRSRQQEGHRLGDIARDLGLKTVTLSRWLKESQGVSLRPVEILASPHPIETSPSVTGVTMTLPNGIRIEGLGLDSVVSLLRHIG
jgi:hypothetical protein